jgi:hypothetical protein
MFRRWRRLDEPGLEVFRMLPVEGGFEATSFLVNAGANPFDLRYRWTLDTQWRTKTVELDLASDENRVLRIERDGDASWRVDGRRRPDLNDCQEIDLSATPFCNTLAIHRMAGKTGELTVVYVDFPELLVTPARQRYETLGGNQWQYHGIASGFTARIDVDEQGFVTHFEGLSEALPEVV